MVCRLRRQTISLSYFQPVRIYSVPDDIVLERALPCTRPLWSLTITLAVRIACLNGIFTIFHHLPFRLPANYLLQYSSQIVETDTASLEFSRKLLRITPHTFVLTVMYPLPPQCWATRILKHWDRCNAQINIGEGKTHTSVSTFVTRIVVCFSLLS